MKTMFFAVPTLLAGSLFADFDWDSVGDSLTIPDGETVVASGADAAKLNGDTIKTITIGTGATLSIEDGSGTVAITNRSAFAGSGTLRIKDASRVDLGGDATAFTGDFFFTNACVHVLSANALGTTNKVTHFCGTTAIDALGYGALSLDVSNVFSNEFHIGSSEDTTSAKNHFGSHNASVKPSVTNAGDIVVECGSPRFRSAFKAYVITGNLLVKGKGYPRFSNGINFRNGTLDMNGHVFCVEVTSGSCGSKVINCPQAIIGVADYDLYRENVFEPTTSLRFGNGDNKAAYQAGGLNLHGYDQVASNLTHYVKGAAYAVTTNTISSSSDACLTIYGAGPDDGLHARIGGGMSVTLDSTDGGTLRITKAPHGDNTMTGALTVKKGLLTIDPDVRFTAVSKLAASGEGVLEVKSSDAFGSKPVLEMGGTASGTLKLSEGVTLIVQKLFVGGSQRDVGYYDKNSSELRIEGEGRIYVSEGREPQNYVWTGEAGDGDPTNGGNWEGNEAPDFGLTYANLKFTNGGTVSIARPLKVRSLAFSGSAPVTLAAANDAAKIVLGDVLTAANGAGAEAVVTNVVSVPIQVPPLDLTWKFGTNTFTRLLGNLSGGLTDNTLTLSRVASKSTGGLELGGRNEALLSQLAFFNILEARVTTPTALGSPERYATVEKSGDHRFYFTGDDVTNRVPLSINSGNKYRCDKTCNYMLTENPHARFRQEGEMTFKGDSTMSLGSYTFAGGVVAPEGAIQFSPESVATYSGKQPDFHVWVVDKPMDLGNSGYFCFWGNCCLHLAAQGNVWGHTRNFDASAKYAVFCETNDVLCASAPYTIGRVKNSEKGNTAAPLDLNGFDQRALTLAHVGADWVPAKGDPTGAITSARPATLTLTPTAADGYFSGRFLKKAALTFRGADDAVWTLGNGVSDTTGGLTVESGTMALKWGACWGGTNVVVSGGTLRIDTGSGAKAFGTVADTSQTMLRLSGAGKLEVVAGEAATVKHCLVNDQPLAAGWYGSPETTDARVPAANKLSAFAGAGALHVLRTYKGGLMLFIR